MCKTSLLTTLIVGLMSASFSLAEEAEAPIDGLTFREPFSGLSASEIRSKLIVFLITDEDPFVWTEAQLDKADKSRLGGAPDVWCGREFRRSFNKMFVDRPDLRDRCIAQRVVAGLPAVLTGGRPRGLPPRTIVAICDGNYRMLTLAVGVPDPEELVRLIEDAEENKALLTLHEDDAERVGTEIAARTKKRVRRIYQESLAKLIEQFGWDDTIYNVDRTWAAKYARIITELQPSFLFDAKVRFGLSDSSDLLRLIVLEQHCETRRDWCETIAPFLVGRPMRDVIAPIIDTTWGMPAVLEIRQDDHKELLDWFAARRPNSTLVFSILPTMLDQNLTWPPPDVSGKPFSKRDWPALETAMSKHPFRTISAEELAVLVQHGTEKPIDLLTPSRVRYILYEPGKTKPVLIRENDVPGKFLKRLGSGKK
jgi:hypothetical protein